VLVVGDADDAHAALARHAVRLAHFAQTALGAAVLVAPLAPGGFGRSRHEHDAGLAEDGAGRHVAGRMHHEGVGIFQTEAISRRARCLSASRCSRRTRSGAPKPIVAAGVCAKNDSARWSSLSSSVPSTSWANRSSAAAGSKWRSPANSTRATRLPSDDSCARPRSVPPSVFHRASSQSSCASLQSIALAHAASSESALASGRCPVRFPAGRGIPHPGRRPGRPAALVERSEAAESRHAFPDRHEAVPRRRQTIGRQLLGRHAQCLEHGSDIGVEQHGSRAAAARTGSQRRRSWRSCARRFPDR